MVFMKRKEYKSKSVNFDDYEGRIIVKIMCYQNEIVSIRYIIKLIKGFY